AAGDLVLMTRGAADTLALWRPDSSAAAAPARVTLDSSIVYLGHDPLAASVRAGDELEVRTRRRLARATSRLYFAGWVLVDAAGQPAVKQLHPLGYVTAMPDAWRPGVSFAERYRVMIPRGLPPGTYGVAVKLYWASGFRNAVAVADDPA